MMQKLCAALVVGFAFSLAAWSGDAKDKDNIDGTWVPTKAELAGKALPDEVVKSIKLVIKGDKYTVTVGKDETDQGTVKVNASAKPKEVDIISTGPNKDKIIKAIYERDGDGFRVCYDLSGKSRPTEFKSKEDTQLFLVSYVRQKP